MQFAIVTEDLRNRDSQWTECADGVFRDMSFFDSSESMSHITLYPENEPPASETRIWQVIRDGVETDIFETNFVQGKRYWQYRANMLGVTIELKEVTDAA